MKLEKLFIINCILGITAFEAWVIMINGTVWHDSVLTYIGLFYFMRMQFHQRKQEKNGRNFFVISLAASAMTALFLWGVKSGNITGGTTISHLFMKSIIVLSGSWIWAYGIISAIRQGTKEPPAPVKFGYCFMGGACMVLGSAVQNVVPICSLASYMLFILVLLNQETGGLKFKKRDIWPAALAFLLSICSTLGKWNDIAKNRNTASISPGFLIIVLVGIIGWFFVWYPLLSFGMEKIYTIQKSEIKKTGKRYFGKMMLLCFLCYVPYFLCFYPGILSDDSITQMRQVMGITPYSNHHPFLHTSLINLWYHMGYGIGNMLGVKGAINMGVALYTLFSMLFMSFVFTCIWCRMKKWNMPRWILLLTFCFYALFPINAAYVVTMWKDVIFAGVVVLFLLNLMDLWEDQIKGNGKNNAKHWIWYVILSFCVCFCRGNGLHAWFVTAPFTLLVFWKSRKRMLGCMLAVTALAVIYKGGVFSLFEVQEADYIESLSIPAQQIACVIAEGNSLPEEDEVLLSNIVDLEKVKTDYLPYISDPIKNLVRDKGNQGYLVSNKAEYLKAYFRIGGQNPFLYGKAWIGQTKGYWFHKENNWIYYPSGVRENEIGIFWDSLLPEYLGRNIEKLLAGTEKLYHKFFSIGLGTYCMLFCFFASCYDRFGRKNKGRDIEIYLFPIALVVTLLAATPVCAEFRYAYAIFVSLPLFAGSTLRPITNDFYCVHIEQ